MIQNDSRYCEGDSYMKGVLRYVFSNILNIIIKKMLQIRLYIKTNSIKA